MENGECKCSKWLNGAGDDGGRARVADEGETAGGGVEVYRRPGGAGGGRGGDVGGGGIGVGHLTNWLKWMWKNQGEGDERG